MLASELMKILKKYPDFEIKTNLSLKVPENNLVQRNYQYPHDNYECELVLDDIGHSDKVLCFGVEVKNSYTAADPKPSQPETLTHDHDQKVYTGRYMHMYERFYMASNGERKPYEMISRNDHIPFHVSKTEITPQAICMAMHNNNKILLLKEYRMAVGQWVYNFPCGLIDDGETVEEASARELNEETGLSLDSITDILPAHYTAVGFSDETVSFITGTASGEFKQSDSIFEQIVPGWYSKSEVKNLIRTEPFGGRTQIYCAIWANS